MTAKLDLTVVIATFNRAEVLRQTLARLEEQTLASDRFEVIVVDDGSPDDTAAVVDDFRANSTLRLRYLKHANRGPGFTENRGIKAAQSELVLLIADDIWSDANLLEEHLDTHKKYPESHFGVLGSVTQSPSLAATQLHRHWDPFQYDRFVHGQKLSGLFFHACNVSVKRSFLLQNGLFMERTAAAHEDIELGYRLANAGLQLIYNRNAHALHHHPETLDGICKRAYERGVNFDLLLDSLPSRLVLPLYKLMAPEAGLGGCLKLLPRELIRAPLFNKLTVPFFWRPILDRADRNRAARLFANRFAYRGVAGHYLRLGFAQMMKQRRCSAGS